MGFKTMVIGIGKDKWDTVKMLGLHYIDSNMQKLVEELVRCGEEEGWRGEGGWGGATVILTTVPGGKAITISGGLAVNKDWWLWVPLMSYF